MQLTTYQEAFMGNAANEQRRNANSPRLDDQPVPAAPPENIDPSEVDSDLQLPEPPVEAEATTEQDVSPGGNVVPQE
jgi:hypothetical protein